MFSRIDPQKNNDFFFGFFKNERVRLFLFYVKSNRETWTISGSGVR